MGKATVAPKLTPSIKAAAARLAKEDGVSRNRWIAAAVARKVGTVATDAGFFRRHAGDTTPRDLQDILALVRDREPDPGDEMPPGIQDRLHPPGQR